MLTHKLESSSLYFIKTASDIIDLIDKLKVALISNKPSPAEILDSIDEYETAIRCVDSSLSVFSGLAKKLELDYMTEFRKFSEIRRDYMTTIEDKKSRNVQMNTMGNFYDEEKILNEISIRNLESKDFVTLRMVIIDEIINPTNYSTLSIINNMDLFGDVLDRMDEIIRGVFNGLDEYISTFKIVIQEVRSLINDADFITAMTSSEHTVETDAYTSKICDVLMFVNKLSDYKNKVKKLYQIYLATESNYEIYDKAVHSYTSLVLESFFNADDVIKF